MSYYQFIFTPLLMVVSLMTIVMMTLFGRPLTRRRAVMHCHGLHRVGECAQQIQLDEPKFPLIYPFLPPDCAN